MGALSDDTRRLCHQIRVMRKIRGAFMKDLKCEATDRRIAVSDMQENFSIARADMARKTKADHLVFISNLKRTVGGKLREFKADLAGARRAWFGKGLRG